MDLGSLDNIEKILSGLKEYSVEVCWRLVVSAPEQLAMMWLEDGVADSSKGSSAYFGRLKQPLRQYFVRADAALVLG